MTTFLGRATGPVAFTGLATLAGYGPLLFAAGAGSLCLGAVAVAVTDSAPGAVDGVPE